MMTEPFDYVKSIQSTKIDLIRTSDDPKLAEKEYNPWLTNKALSFHIDSILYANEMNSRHYLDHALQYGYYINTIRSMKRPFIFHKKAKVDEDIQFIVEHYKMNRVRAKEVYSVLGSKKIDEIRNSIVKGGIVSSKKKKVP